MKYIVRALIVAAFGLAFGILGGALINANSAELQDKTTDFNISAILLKRTCAVGGDPKLCGSYIVGVVDTLLAATNCVNGGTDEALAEVGAVLERVFDITPDVNFENDNAAKVVGFAFSQTEVGQRCIKNQPSRL